jgi:hypothetical protein
VAERDLSATLAAWILTEAGEGRLDGAMYFPVASIVPTVAFPEGTPFTDQVTAWLEFAVTVAENWVLSPGRRVALGGAIVIPLEVEPELPAVVPPPQPDHTRMTRERTRAPANLAPEDCVFPIISDPLS